MDNPSNNPINQLQIELMANCKRFPKSLSFFQDLWNQAVVQNKYSKPMVWIGIYIAIASLFCILPMFADLFHGFKDKKMWFPCKYFTLNAASLTVIAVAMKLPMDLNNLMPYDVDQSAKLGSMAFMCTIMANLLSSLATMNSKELLTNTIALGILVITMVVNVCIQMKTGLISKNNDSDFYNDSNETYNHWSIAFIYVVMLLVLLMIHTCSALMILKSKQILESKYKAGHETALKDLELSQPTIEKLKQHVNNHWIMAGTGSPQFMAVYSATTAAAGVICVSSAVVHGVIMHFTIPHMKHYGSDYKWSVILILITQFTGVLLGTIAPISRCFAPLSFKVSIKRIWNHIKVFEVENYCIEKLSEWKQSSVPFKLSSRRRKIVIQDLKVMILSLCIGIQKMVVVLCKMLALTPIFFVIGIVCCLHCWKWLKHLFGASDNVLVKTPAQLQHSKDLCQFVLKLEDDIEPTQRTLASMSISMNHVIRRAEKQQPNNLMKLLEVSSSFEEVGKYDLHEISKEKHLDCWSLPLVNLTIIAISLPKIQKDTVERLLRSMSEGLTYVRYVEETLNASEEYAIIQKAARTLWLEVEVYQKWLGNKLLNTARQSNTTKEIVHWFSDTAKNMVTEEESKNIKGLYDNSLHKLASATSMYRITQTILAYYPANLDQVSQDELFVQLSFMISHILAACLTNLSRVITMRCHTSVIEKREAGVQTAAQLLGETMQIINSLQNRELPSLKPDEFPFIDKWRDCYLHPSP